MIAIGCDHAAYDFKEEIKTFLEEEEIDYKDFGCFDKNRTDYPIFAEKVGRAVAQGECERGLLFCGTGVGMSIAVNKIKGIRAVVCSDCYSAKMSRKHNNANVLALGARVVGIELAKLIIKEWLFTEYEGDRHQRRVDMITKLENKQGRGLCE